MAGSGAFCLLVHSPEWLAQVLEPHPLPRQAGWNCFSDIKCQLSRLAGGVNSLCHNASPLKAHYTDQFEERSLKILRKLIDINSLNSTATDLLKNLLPRHFPYTEE